MSILNKIGVAVSTEDSFSGGKSLAQFGEGGVHVEAPSVLRAAIDTFNIKSGYSSEKIISNNYPRNMNMYKRYLDPSGEEEPVVPVLPVYSSSMDFLSFIQGNPLTQSDIYASIFSFGSDERPLSAVLRCILTGASSIGSLIRGISSTSTSPLEYENILVATKGGFSLIKRVLTKLPDLMGFIHGWDELDLGVFIRYTYLGHRTIYGNIRPVVKTSSDIYSSIIAIYDIDLEASLVTIPGSVLLGELVSVAPSNLISFLRAVPPKDLRAFGGGHYPEHLSANIVINQPVSLGVLIRCGLSSVYDLQASLLCRGYLSYMPARIGLLLKGKYNLKVSITSRIPKSLRAYIYGYEYGDLQASIEGVYSSDIGGWITPWYRGRERNLPSFIRPSWGGDSSVKTFIHGWISAHTTDKPYNFHLYKRLPQKIIVGHKRGAAFLNIEVVRGTFPDLKAHVVGIPLYISDFYAYLNSTIPTSKDLNIFLSSVTPIIHIKKLVVNIVNMSHLGCFISAFSGYKNISSSIIGWVSTSTDTSEFSGWLYSSSIFRFYLGTTKGLLIVPSIKTAIRPINFINTSRFPDLWSYIYGWNIGDLGGYIKVQPYSNIKGTLVSLDLSYTSSFFAFITSTYTKDIVGSILGHGSFVDLYSSIHVSGGSSSLTVIINPYLNIQGYRIIPVETRPFSDLRAIITLSGICSGSSSFSSLSCFIRAGSILVGSGFLSAEINPRPEIINLAASVIGRIITRIKILDLYFRPKNRYSVGLSCFVSGIGKGINDLTSYIKGMFHENDLGASVTVVRHYIPKPEVVPRIKVYKQMGISLSLLKELELSFSSSVRNYIYDALDKMVYSLGDGKWALNLEEVTTVAGFYDRDPRDRHTGIDSMVDYNSVDEAIRAAIVLLTERHAQDIGAYINVTGSIQKLQAEIVGMYADRVSELPTKIMIVSNMPDISAYISAFSGLLPMRGSIIGVNSSVVEIPSSVLGVIYEELQAEVNPVT